MLRTHEGTTGRLLQLCAGYFAFYVITGLTVKYFLGSTELGMPGMSGMTFLVYSTLGGTAIATGTVLVLRWFHLGSEHIVRVGPLQLPAEVLYIVPSGVCTAVVIPTTTLMYTLPISVMVAMVIMRGAVIVIGRLVDAIQIAQGILHKKVYWQENVAVLFAIGAVSIKIVFSGGSDGRFEFLRSPAAITILSSYICAYAVRIYLMNYYKNTRGAGRKQNNKAFFGIEQLAACSTLILVTLFLYHSPRLVGWDLPQVTELQKAIDAPHDRWVAATFAGMAFGIVAFFSVFIFMFKGRTATFAGLVNRLTSLIAGTVATLLFAIFFNSAKFPKKEDWLALGFILVAVGFLTVAERRRAAELIAAHEIEPDDGDEAD